jgi:plasmid stability protein
MSKMIQIRHVPDATHRLLKVRAAAVGKTLSDFLLEEIERVAARPSPTELRERLATREPVVPTLAPAAAVRAERDSG